MNGTEVPTSPPPDVAPRRVARRPGRPALYVFTKPDHQLTEEERKRKRAIEKRRDRQNRSYHRRKHQRQALRKAENAVAQSQTLQSVRTTNPPFSNSQSPPQWAQPPPMIPGFAQNPLELLATATATGPLSDSPLVADRASSVSERHAVSMNTSVLGAAQSTQSSIASFQSTSLNSSMSAPSIPSAGLPVASPTEPLEIDATAADALDVSMSFAEGKDAGADEDATEILMNSALVAAKEYSKDPLSLKDVMDRERDLRRMTGIKTIIFDNLRTKYIGFNKGIQSALRHFIIFPRTFNLRAAAAVAGLEESQLVRMQGMLDSMIQSNFITSNKGRYQLNEAARLFLCEDEKVTNEGIAEGSYEIARTRFVDHYRTQLRSIQDDNINVLGWVREQAMALFDNERENMNFSQYLLTGRNKELRCFLSAGITVMRYCISAGQREEVLLKALADEETSTEDIFKSLGMDTTGGEFPELKTPDDEDSEKAHRARLYLALSEAYFDQLKIEEAEQPLLEALKLLQSLSPKASSKQKGIVIDSVLVLLLLSNLRMSTGKIKEAQSLCMKALKILKEASLGRSTFGINAMSNLVGILLSTKEVEKAKQVTTKVLDTLHDMRYTGMPIYADVLGVCAMVSMAEDNYAQAEQQYGTALEVVGKWGNKEWAGIPMQHCMDLDLWLLEGLAEAIRKQGRIGDAEELERRAMDDRKGRGLIYGDEELDVSTQDVESKRKRSSLRHLY